MPSRIESARRWWKAIFRFLSSVKLAVILLVILIIATAIGTICESRFDARVARAYVYDAPWFNAWMILLGVNLAAGGVLAVSVEEASHRLCHHACGHHHPFDRRGGGPDLGRRRDDDAVHGPAAEQPVGARRAGGADSGGRSGQRVFRWRSGTGMRIPRRPSRLARRRAGGGSTWSILRSCSCPYPRPKRSPTAASPRCRSSCGPWAGRWTSGCGRMTRTTARSTSVCSRWNAGAGPPRSRCGGTRGGGRRPGLFPEGFHGRGPNAGRPSAGGSRGYLPG